MPNPCYNRAVMNSDVRIVPVAAACDRRRTDRENSTGCWSVAGFVKKPQIEPVAPTLHSPRQSSLIKPNQAISCLDAIQSQSPSCSKIATSPNRLPKIPTCHAVSPRRSLAKAEAKRSRVKAGQSQSKRFPIVTPGPRFQPLPQYIAVFPTKCTIHCGLPLQPTPIQPCNPQSRKAVMNQRISESASGNSELIGSLGPAPLTAPANPQFHLIPLNSTWFHLIPLPAPTGPDHPMHYQSAIRNRQSAIPLGSYFRFGPERLI